MTEENKSSTDDTFYKWSMIADLIDKFRAVPRLLMLFYILVFYYSADWFMSLTDPTAPQAAFISTIVGAGAAWFGLYVNSGGRK